MSAAPDDVARLRIPPHSIEAEQSVLGSILLSNEAFVQISDSLLSTDFFRHEHRTIYAAMAALIVAKQPVDIITLYERLKADGDEEKIGGLVYLNALSQSVPTALNVERYAEIVRERSILRATVAAADEIAAAAFRGIPIEDLLDNAKLAFGRIDQRRGPNANRLPLLALPELREVSAQTQWLVKHVVPADSIGMVFGASGTFKSFIALDAALHVAHGLPWMGRRTTQGPVLYIAAEGGTGLWKRVVAWHRSRRTRWEGVPLYVVPCALDLRTDAWRVVEAAQAVGIHPSMVVVDTLSQTYSGEENSANEMAAYMRELGARFRQLWHCSVMLIHHTGHQVTERPRGSSAIRANVDFMFGVFRDEKEMLATLTCSKQKDQDPFADSTFQLTSQELGTDEDGDRVTSLVARHLTSPEDVQEAMQAESSAGRGGSNQLLLSLAQAGGLEAGLRKAFYEDCGIDNTDTRKKAYQRARSWAIKAGFLEFVQGRVITLKNGGNT